jgi:hypothetical protein
MQPNTSQGALAALQQYQASAKTPDQIMAEQNQNLGVTAAQQNVSGLRGAVANTTRLLEQVAPSVMGRTANSLVTSAQAGRQVANESAPISQNLHTQGDALSTAQADYQMLSNQANTNANLAFQGQEGQRSYLQKIYETLYQSEQDAAKTAAAERDRQEAIRQFNASQSAKGSGLASPSFSLPNAPVAKTSAAAPAVTPAQQNAYNKAKALIDTKDNKRIESSYKAIQKSAGYGNGQDKMILDFLNSMGYSYLGAPLPGLGSQTKPMPYSTPTKPATNTNGQLFSTAPVGVGMGNALLGAIGAR